MEAIFKHIFIQAENNEEKSINLQETCIDKTQKQSQSPEIVKNEMKLDKNSESSLQNKQFESLQSNPHHQIQNDEVNSNQGNCLYVSNLSHRITESSLDRIFRQYGKVENVYICYEPYSQQQKGQKVPRGFGFVKYSTNQEAQQAISMLNGQRIKNKKIKIVLSKRGIPQKSEKGPYYGKNSSRNKTSDVSKSPSRQEAPPSPTNISQEFLRRSQSSSSESNGDLTYYQKIKNRQNKYANLNTSQERSRSRSRSKNDKPNSHNKKQTSKYNQHKKRRSPSSSSSSSSSSSRSSSNSRSSSSSSRYSHKRRKESKRHSSTKSKYSKRSHQSSKRKQKIKKKQEK